ncbi:3',5'-cyclic-AMP phosphodiesterase [Pseudomonas sp. gcc21]|uniref:3',5'-cyclic-AMP phosphodiesterase n=1 Tax=Pseudomonas sp. gcc21 TaxID=2726989 RepID=UPI0014522432|nr:3',5'-cyclic-AMP phosphodiesterase [Pseudomonas sp. gcc21]QJD59001.1 3',5'-cyclic-AMP phosphodiesterase [Pseudomonas sp. gcc21]
MPPVTTTEAGYVSIVQLTDSHLFADHSARLLGLDTFASLNAVIDQVLDEVDQMDLVLATGDITQDGSEGGYQRFIEAIGRLPAACRWIPGNHDDAALMATLGDASGLNADWIDLANWRIVLLDSSIPGAVPGRLDAEQLDHLDAALASAGERHVLVCLHHHPIDIESDWMNPLGLQNADEFLQRVDSNANIRGLLWGHIHQQLDAMRGKVRLLATPSTCIQFDAHSADFATDTQSPGYRWLRLHTDGSIETEVSRLPAGRFVPDPDASGY